MLRQKSKKVLSLILAIVLVVAAIPISIAGSTADVVDGLLLNVDFGADGTSLDTGNPVKENAVIKQCGENKAATLDATGVGSLTYHFTDLAAVGKASVMLTGRAIMGATVDVNVKVNESDAWTKVTTLGSPNSWEPADSVLYDLSKTVAGATDFYLQIVFNDGACGDWASVRRLRVATVAQENVRSSGTVISSDFSDDSWVAEAESGSHFTDWGSRLSNSFPDGLTVVNCDVENAEIIYHLKDLEKIGTIRALFNIERVFNGPYFELLGSKDGITYTSLAKIDSDADKNPAVDFTDYAAGVTELYLKLIVCDKNMGDWAILNGFQVQTISAPAMGAEKTELLNVDFGADGASLDTGNPVKENAVIKQCGENKAATLDATGVGSLTYHFTDLAAVGKASVMLTGRAIMGATVDVNVKVNESDAWTKVTTLGSPNSWEPADSVLYDLSKTVAGATDFYLQIVFNDGACGDWASVRRLRVATVAQENVRSSGTVINSDFSDDSWIAEAESGSHFTDWGSRLSNSFPDGLTVVNCDVDNAEIVYHLKDLNTVDTMAATFIIERVFNGPYFELLGSKDGITYTSLAKIDSDANKKPMVNLTDYASGVTELYLKLIVCDKNMGDWAILNGFQVVSTSAENTPAEPDLGPVATELLNADFGADGASLDAGNPVKENATIKQCGDNKAATLNTTGVGSLTYHFTDLAAIGKASVMLTGRAIMGATVDVNVKVNESDTWTKVATLGSPNHWEPNDSIIYDLSQHIYKATDFYLQVVFNDGACGDWASVRRLRVATVAASEIRYVGTLVNDSFAQSSWTASVNSGSYFSDWNPEGSLSIVDAGYTRDKNVNAELVYRLGGLAAVEKMKATIDFGRKIGSETYVELLAGTNGSDYTSIYKSELGSDISTGDVSVDMTEFASGKTVLYVKLVVHDTQMGDWVMLNGFKIESESTSEPTPEPQPSSFTLLDVNFNDDGALSVGSPELSNITDTKNGGEGLPYGATVDQAGKGSIIYKFTNETQFKDALLVMKGRAIIGASITVSVKVGDEWKDVKKLGGSSDWNGSASIDLSKYVNGSGTFYLQFYFDDGACGDWAMINSLHLTATTNGLPAEEEQEKGETIFAVDFSKEDWRTQYPIESISDNMQWKSFDGGTGIMPTVKDGESSASDTAYIIYKVENINPQNLVLYANHRSCSGVEVNFQFSKDGKNFSVISKETSDHLNPAKPAEIDLSKAAIGCSRFYIKVEIPANMCYDWGVLTALKLVNTPTDLQQTYLLDVDFSKEDWKSQHQPESVVGLKQGDYEYSYQVFKKGVYRDGTSETGSIVYHVTGAEGVDALTLLINNRACNGAKTIVSISLDGNTFREVATITQDNLDFGTPFDLDLSSYVNDTDDFYLKLELPQDSIEDWNVLACVKVLAQIGDIKTFYRLDTKGNIGGTVEVTSKVEAGQQATATAVPNSGYNFVGWYNYSGDLLSEDLEYTFVPDDNMTLIGRFFPTYDGEGQLVLAADYNDLGMSFLEDAYDYDNITVMLDDGLKVAGKYGQALVRADSGVAGSITYKFENLGELERFKAVVDGRAIMKATIDFQISSNGSTWKTVKQLGGPTEDHEFGYNETREVELIDYVKDLPTFYVKVVFNIVGLQDWAALRSVMFIANGSEAEEIIIPDFADGPIGNIANTNREGSLLDQNITYEDYTDYLYYISNMYIADVEGENGEADKGLMVMDRTLNGEVIWKFDNLKPVTKFLMTFKGQAVNDSLILLRVSTDGENWQSVTGGRLDSVNGTDFKIGTPVTYDMTSRVEGATSVYIRALFTASAVNSDAFLTNISAESQGKEQAQKPDEEENPGNEDNQQGDGKEDNSSQLPDTGETRGIIWLVPVIIGSAAAIYTSRKIKKYQDSVMK